MRVLIIEDEENIQKLLAINLRHENYAVSRAYDAIEGIKLAQNSIPYRNFCYGCS